MRFVKYLMTGGASAGIEYVSFLLFLLFLPVVVANPLSFSLGFLVSFLLNKRWVFKVIGGTKGQLVKYFALAMINLALSTIVIVILVDYLNILESIAKVVVIGMIALWNYIVFSRVIFTHKDT